MVVVSYTARSVFLSWKPSFDGNTEILGYNIFQNDLDRENKFHLVQAGSPTDYTANETDFNITNAITPYTKYVFVVEACNALGCSDRDSCEPSTPIRTEPDGQFANIIQYTLHATNVLHDLPCMTYPLGLYSSTWLTTKRLLSHCCYFHRIKCYLDAAN